MGKRLQFADEEKAPDKPKRELKADDKIAKLEQKSEALGDKMAGAEKSLPQRRVKTRKRIYNEEAGKSRRKLEFETEAIPIGETKWNQTKKPVSRRVSGYVGRNIASKIHGKVYEVEDQNVGTKAAHRGELIGESAYRSGKRTAGKAYRFHKNRPYRKAEKAAVKSSKVNAKLSYRRALQNAPKKKNPISRMLQKRALKRKYIKAKKAAVGTKKTVGLLVKVGALIKGAIVKKKLLILLIKPALLGLLILAIMAMLSMCMSLFSGVSGALTGIVYLADYEHIDDAEIAYGEWTIDLMMYIQNVGQNHPSFDEYRLDVGYIGHNPFELMAFLTAVYGEFTFAEVEPTLRRLFDQQYRLVLTETVEIRTRNETRIDDYGEEYEVEVEYEWRVLYVTLHSTPLSAVIFPRMNYDQWQHFNILMMSLGARQLVGNPFDFNWLPHVSSRYGYRIHPISGERSFHGGIDIAVSQGTEILAGFDGTVTQVAYDRDGYGNFVVIDDGDGVQALYAHCHAVFVTVGQSVREGDVIATVGNTGASTGAHLHMEVIQNGRRLNPLFFVVTGFEGDAGGGQILTGNENMVPLDMFTWPLAGNYPITSPFGWRIHPISGQRRHHNGIDLGAPHGTPILAMADGIVTVANATDSWGGGWGFFVRIAHEGGFETLYAHASSVAVQAGQHVQQGEVIAFVGTTGSSTGNHLHFEVVRNGSPVDPMQFFRPN